MTRTCFLVVIAAYTRARHPWRQQLRLLDMLEAQLENCWTQKPQKGKRGAGRVHVYCPHTRPLSDVRARLPVNARPDAEAVWLVRTVFHEHPGAFSDSLCTLVTDTSAVEDHVVAEMGFKATSCRRRWQRCLSINTKRKNGDAAVSKPSLSSKGGTKPCLPALLVRARG